MSTEIKAVSNSAAWLTQKYPKPLEVKPAPYTPPEQNQIVVKNGAIAINPVDYIKQNVGNLAFSWVKPPFIMGSDLAGEVVEVGPGVTRFRVGDRVLANAVGMDPRCAKSSEGAFQQCTVVRENMASPIPDSMSYEEASVLPLTFSTAACGLFQKDQLALQYPTVSPKPNGQTVLVWGGSTSVGSNAIQLAVAAGYEVIATSSPRNFDYVKKLGASEAFDYKSKTAVQDIIKALEKKESAGAVAVGTGSLSACIDILKASKGRKFIAQASIDMAEGFPQTGFVTGLIKFLLNGIRMWVKGKMSGVRFKFIFGTDLAFNELGTAVWENFLPEALAQGKYQAAPSPEVVGKGLEHVQKAMNELSKGVSAKKLVVTL